MIELQELRYQYRYGTVLYCTVPYRTVCYIYRTVWYRPENLEIMERGEADPILSRGYGADRREILERRGAALMEYDNDRREAPRLTAL